jgi:hypothetical protein
MADLVTTLAEVDTAIASAPVDHDLAEAIRWPTMKVYAAVTPAEALAAAAGDGYDQAAVLAPDAPDLPAMVIGKLLRPLGSRPRAVAPAHDGGLIGIAARLSEALPDLGWGSPVPPDVAVTAGWHRLISPAGLARLNPNLEGWEATRALLSYQPAGSRLPL